MFKEDSQYVEPLVYLAVSVNQVAVVHGEHVIHTDVNIDACETILVFEQRHLDCWHIAESALLCNLFDDLAAVLD